MNPDKSIHHLILDFIRDQGLAHGSHMPAQVLADRFNVFRSPVNDALAFFESKGLLRREPNRGYFLAKAFDVKIKKKLGIQQANAISQTYFRIADDVLKGVLPLEVTESFIKTKYELTAAQLKAVLYRISQDGWAQRKTGYGWGFSAMLTTPDQFHERGVRFQESLVEASGNPFFIDTIRSVNRIRRLTSYRSMQDRKRYLEHCEQHLQVLDLIAKGKRLDAAEMMRKDYKRTLENHQKIRCILNP
jgi:DNA-binding GntR family transcriptional regulator